MNKKDTHNEQTREFLISDSLRVSPFSIPENFFSIQEKSIHAQVRIENLVRSTETTNYTVPEHYFDQLEEQILLKIAESKLKDKIPTLDYEVSDGYFDGLTQSIQAKLVEQKLKESVSETGFDIPSDYFTDQKNALIAKISEGSLKSKVAEDGFIVPTHYFENLANSIQSAVLAPEQTIIVPIAKKSNWFSYAAAAAVVFIIGIGSYFALQQQTEPTSFADVRSVKDNLRAVSDDEIVDYLAQISEGDELIHLTKMVEEETSTKDQIDKNLDEEEIKEYLNYML